MNWLQRGKRIHCVARPCMTHHVCVPVCEGARAHECVGRQRWGVVWRDDGERETSCGWWAEVTEWVAAHRIRQCNACNHVYTCKSACTPNPCMYMFRTF